MDLKIQVPRILWEQEHVTPEDANVAQWHRAFATAVISRVPDVPPEETSRCVAYFSAEFLIGRMIHNYLLNLGLLEQAEELLQAHGLSVSSFEELEDAGLGNGGLGRLAACFLDSAATLDIPLYGYGIRYRYGLFRQHFTDGCQRESPDDWQKYGDAWSRRREDERVMVRFGGHTVYAVPYDMPVIGYGGHTVNRLRLWQSEAVVPFDLEQYDKQEYETAFQSATDAACISAVLYPNDSTDRGRAMRLCQQYFLCSASLQDLLQRYRRRVDLQGDIADWLAIQLNDTHPVIAIPELMRLLIKEEACTFDDALDIARRVFAYTNHTILPEALETWDAALMRTTIPSVYALIEQLQKRLEQELAQSGIPRTRWSEYAIVNDGVVHMANLAVYVCHAVNGVAQLHTELLTTSLFPMWYQRHPDKFQNKTNGITQRRWLKLANPPLSKLITDTIGDGWITDLSQLEQLVPYAEDEAFVQAFLQARQACKQRLCRYMEQREGVSVPSDWLYDVQAKRLHEYKRQLLNAFSIVDTYYSLREGDCPDFQPTVYLFGAKAAAGYARAKGIIRYIHEIASLVNHDAAVNDRMQVRFVTNYDVSYAEYLLPAADVSEQISVAGMEASGTGNMKMMLNGAVTLGTLDGANVEIFAAAGEENNYRFGATVEELAALRAEYNPVDVCKREPRIRRVVESLVDGTFSDGGSGQFRELYDSLLYGASWHAPDPHFVLGDFLAYTKARARVNRDYTDRAAFARKGILNMAHAGRFSSDRTVREYATDIWRI